MIATTTSENFIGAIIFWAYIVAALLFTGLILRDLVALYNQSFDLKVSDQKALQNGAQRRARAHIILGLSVISFATLSYHMLSFLIDSYSAWAKLNRVVVPKTLFGPQGIIDLDRKQLNLEPWRWSTASTLFQDFAQVICNDPRRFWWAQQALMYSFGWNVFMCIQGVRYQVPHLWQYFVLNQILPISFTQNLFCTAIVLSQHRTSDDSLLPSTRVKQRLTLCLYLAGLAMAPFLTESAWFFVVLASTRVLLLAPYVFLRPTLISGVIAMRGKGSRGFFEERILGFILGGLMSALQAWRAGLLPWQALNAGPAVASLGYDFLIACGSLAVFMLIGK